MSGPPAEKMSLPIAKFIDDVGKYLQGKTGDEAIAQLNEQYQMYIMVEQQLQQKRARLMGKLPETQRALDAVNLLIKKREADETVLFDFELGNSVYAKARIPPASAVNLWLGADVMLQYPIEEAQTLLENNVKNCKMNTETTELDIGTIKDFKTTTEVNIARIYNFALAKKATSRASIEEEPDTVD